MGNTEDCSSAIAVSQNFVKEDCLPPGFFHHAVGVLGNDGSAVCLSLKKITFPVAIDDPGPLYVAQHSR